MAIIEITEVVKHAVHPEYLWGQNIDQPKPATKTGGHMVEISGWVLGRLMPVVAVEVVHEGRVIRRTPIAIRREDITKAFPQATNAQESGYRTQVSLMGGATFELQVQAVMRDQSRIVLGTIHARRRWREEGDATPLVSVIIPCYGHAHFLPEAIESVLAQTYPHMEIVVVDDGSQDNVAAVATSYPGVRCVQQTNQGLSAARNTGIQRSNGNFLVFLDADDRLCPVALEAGLDCLNTHPECAIAAGLTEFIALDGSALPTGYVPLADTEDAYSSLLQRNLIWCPGAVMYRRSVFETMRGFDTTLDSCEDYDLYLRIARDFSIAFHDTRVAQYRKHGQGMSLDTPRMLSAVLKVLRRQRPYVQKNKHHTVAWQKGMLFYQHFYGQPLVETARGSLREGRLRSALPALSTLLRCYPRGLVSALTGLPLPRPPQYIVEQRISDLLLAQRQADQIEISSLRQKLHEQDWNLDAAQSKVARLEKQVAERDEVQTAARAEIAAKEQAIQALHTEIEQLQQTIAERNQAVQARQSEIDRLQRIVAEQTTVQQQTLNEISQLQQMIARYYEQQQADQTRIAGLQRQLAEQQAARQPDQDEIARLQQLVAGQNSHQQEALNEISRLQQAINERDAALHSARAEITGLRQTLSGQNSVQQSTLHELHRLYRVVAEHETTNADTQAELVYLKQVVADHETRQQEVYQNGLSGVREAVEQALPPTATGIVISRGDENLVNINGRKGWHFPCNEHGWYAGHYPANSAEAIAHMESLREHGGDFLLIPAASFWWLHYYREFQHYLDTTYQRIWSDAACVIYQLNPQLNPLQSGNGTEVSSARQGSSSSSVGGQSSGRDIVVKA